VIGNNGYQAVLWTTDFQNSASMRTELWTYSDSCKQNMPTMSYCEDYSLLSCDTMQSGRLLPTFWRNLLPPPSRQKIPSTVKTMADNVPDYMMLHPRRHELLCLIQLFKSFVHSNFYFQLVVPQPILKEACNAYVAYVWCLFYWWGAQCQKDTTIRIFS
jgi:hypothetical protein